MSSVYGPSASERYQLLEWIGGGGFGNVWQAFDRHMKRLVAIKLLPLTDDDPQCVDRFVQEVESHARLHHPHLVQVYDAGHWDGGGEDRLYLVMQLIDGGNLGAMLGDASFRDPRRAAKLVACAARALHFAHGEFVIHCDVKPSNILIDRKGAPYVTDFGIAHMLNREMATSPSGSLDYMAPEQCDVDGNGLAKDRSHWTDVYGLGAVLYHLVTGEPPYASLKTIEARKRAFEEGVYPDAAHEVARRNHHSVGACADHALSRICRSALSINPLERYNSAKTFADDLDRWYVGMPIVGPGGTRPRIVKSALLFARRNAIALLPLVALVVISIVGSLLLRDYLTHTLQAQWAATNEALAGLQTRIFRKELARVSSWLEELAKSPQVLDALEAHANDETDKASIWAEQARPTDPEWGFEQIYILDPDGYIRMHWPHNSSPEIRSKWYGFRRYFRCAMELADVGRKGACLSAAYESEHDWEEHTRRVAIATPIYRDGRVAGVLVATRQLGSSFASVQFGRWPGLSAASSLLLPCDVTRDQLRVEDAALVSTAPASSKDVNDKPSAHVRPDPAQAEPQPLIEAFKGDRDGSRKIDDLLTQRIRQAGRADQPITMFDYRDPNTHQLQVASIQPIDMGDAYDRSANLAFLVVATDLRVVMSNTWITVAYCIGVNLVLAAMFIYTIRSIVRRDAQRLRLLERADE